MAPLLHVDWNDIVFVSNATTGINAVLKSLWELVKYHPSLQQRKRILHLSTVYGAIGQVAQVE